MKTKDIIDLDYRDKKNKQIIQKALGRIKPLEKYADEDEIPFEVIEKLLHQICSKYQVWLQSITHDPVSGDGYDIWRCGICDERTLTHLITIHSMCLYELFAKVVIYLWSEIKNEKLKRR